jgi:hypothetical protein
MNVSSFGVPVAGFRLRVATCAIAAIAMLAVGCGGEPRGHVSGRVVRDDGTPVAAAVIMARAEKTGKSASAQTDVDGHYSLGVAQMGDGLPPGDYALIVMEERMGLDGGGNRTISARYRDYEQSGLSFSVADGEAKTFDVTVDGP